MLTLTQMIKAVAKQKPTLSGLGFSSKTEFDDIAGGIPELRNQIVHPVGSLILKREDLKKLSDRVEKIRELNSRVAAFQVGQAAAAFK